MAINVYIKMSISSLCIILIIINANRLIAKKLTKKGLNDFQAFFISYELEEFPLRFGLKESKTLDVSSSTPSL